ncbi:MFS transporter [Holospora curviuscula]|uniref:Major Facilitator Superfamily protein n=1 Tax=Holospora curviuscula TaxID=1082868 RepID=A0A2S5R8G2_9PROT|nr:MFS transporter [Holospora curviuscula]PPE03616.1 Major Facilitator Superfamily protein [Holospora curviuscula]
MNTPNTLNTNSIRLFCGIPLALWILSLGMFLLNCSSVIVFTCLPFLSFKKSTIGRLEGVVEGLSLICRAAAGLLSDVVKRRKRFLLVGYGICAIARLLLAAASSFESVVFARVVEKIGNGIQASPREALIADIAPVKSLGKFYGLNKALGMTGSTLGSSLLIFLFFFYGKSVTFQQIFLYSGLLACVSFVMLLFGVKEVKFLNHSPSTRSFGDIWTAVLQDLKQLPWNFWKVILCIFFLKMGYFSGAFMMNFAALKNPTEFLGIPLNHPGQLGAMIMTFQNVLCAMCSYPLGWLSDYGDRRRTVFLCNLLLLSAMMSFGFLGHWQWGVLLGVLFYGLQYSLQGALMAFLSSSMPAHLQGTGFGVFFSISGTAILISNGFIMGTVWECYSPNIAFLAVCIPVIISLLFLPFIKVFLPYADSSLPVKKNC